MRVQAYPHFLFVAVELLPLDLRRMQHSVSNAEFLARVRSRPESTHQRLHSAKYFARSRVLGFGLGGAGALLGVLRVGHFDRRLALTRRNRPAPFIEALL